MATDTVCIPTDLSAFVLTPACCEDKPGVSRIAPITQPNYLGLQLSNSLIQHDILDHVDFHLTAPWQCNPRVADLTTETPTLRKNRLGVYLHWSLPRLYRTGRSSDSDDVAADGSQPSQPTFRMVPNRWMIVRHLRQDPKLTDPPNKLPDLPEYQSWIVESDCLRDIDDLGAGDAADLETDAVPFVSYGGALNAEQQQEFFHGTKSPHLDADGILEQQQELFLGKKSPHLNFTPSQPRGQTGWQESGGTRPGLTVMSSSNPLFPDHTFHNSNVFSTIDSFEYHENPSDPNSALQHLNKATADYFVLGWHSNDGNGPLSDVSKQDFSDRLSALMLQLDAQKKPNQQGSVSTKTDKDDGHSYGTLVYGAMYGVTYDVNSKPPSQADDAATKFTKDLKIEPLSVGTTALDGILTFLEAHDSKHAADEEAMFPGGGNAAEDVFKLASLLYAADDSYDERIRAQDLLYSNKFASTKGGTIWQFAGNAGKATTGGPPPLPTTDEELKLATLNEIQSQVDALGPRLQSLRWELFSWWWKFVSDPDISKDKKQATYMDPVRRLKDDIVKTSGRLEFLQSTINTQKTQVACKASAKQPFWMAKDPTLCIAGLDSGWPAEFMDKATITLGSALKPTSSSLLMAHAFFNQSAPIMKQPEIREPAQDLLADFIDRLASSNSSPDRAHKNWGGKNPFQPLFIEWEARYYHIDRNKWTVAVRPSPVGHGHDQVRYGLKARLNDDDQKDVRTISGRVILTPQPSFSLEAIVSQVMGSLPPLPKDPSPSRDPAPPKDGSNPEAVLNGTLPLTADEVDEVNKKIRNLQFISSPLSGLTEHLLTKYEGTHVKPNFRAQGQKLWPLGEAERACKPINDEGSHSMVNLIDSESALTPYANLIDFGGDNYPGVPFKPVTHGQLMFTQLNIVDKFGQAICIPEPRFHPVAEEAEPLSFYPNMSDFVSPDILPEKLGGDGKLLNTVFHESGADGNKWPLSRFVQLTPSINQNARLNASFLNPNSPGQGPPWRETVDDMHESPVFGWLVLNYQDNGVQFFLPDGTFYREVRVGGSGKTTASAKWLPFDPPTGDKATGNAQLDQLISRLTLHTEDSMLYMAALVDMVNSAIKNMPYPPSDYSAYANAIVGKPLALVNCGFSLELQQPPMKAQNTLGRVPDPNEPPEIFSYQFPIKVGDRDRPFDGLVGYWKLEPDTGTKWDTVYTYFPSSRSVHVVNLTADHFIPLHPYYSFQDVDVTTMPNDPSTTASFTQRRCSKYSTITALIDPYTAIHAYSGILPIVPLRLQPWTIQQAFSRMTAFFRLGPSLLTNDVPVYIDSPLLPDSWNTVKDPTTASNADKAAAPIKLPISGHKGLWNWLQPYDVDGKDATTGKATGKKVTRFNAMDVGEEDTRIRNEPGPYTFVEGYLQLARPLLSERKPT